MTRLRIALVVADPARDLPATVLTAYELCQRGATCFVIPLVSARAELFSLAPDYVLMPAVRPYPLTMTFQLVSAGIQFGFIETETPYESSFNAFMNPIRKDTDLRRQISCVCCWRRETAEQLSRERLLDSNQLILSGCPQLDYYSAPLAGVYNRGGQVRTQRDKIVLISTNFSLANPRFEQSDLAIDSYVRTYGYEMDQVTHWFGNEVRAVDEMANLANQVASDFPHARIIFRPNHEEQNDTYQRRLAKLPNLRLTTRGSLLSWTARSAAVIQGGRIGAISACLMQVPVLSPKWISSGAERLLTAVSIPCVQYPNLRKVLADVLSGNLKVAEADSRKTVAIIENEFHKLDGLAHKRVATAIMETIKPGIRPNLKRCRGLLSLISDQRSFRLQTSMSADIPVPVSSISQLVASITSAKHAEQPRKVSTYSANKGGAYVSYQYRGRAVVMTCSSTTSSV